MNVEPCARALETAIVPCACCAIPKIVARPSPIPLPRGFVVKNGSKIRARVSGSIPQPVSLTDRQT